MGLMTKYTAMAVPIFVQVSGIAGIAWNLFSRSKKIRPARAEGRKGHVAPAQWRKQEILCDHCLGIL
jgi:hypothetical protein